jgi:hypothetical protein
MKKTLSVKIFLTCEQEYFEHHGSQSREAQSSYTALNKLVLIVFRGSGGLLSADYSVFLPVKYVSDGYCKHLSLLISSEKLSCKR